MAPLRDIFGAIFFVSVGMMLDPGVIAEHWPALIALIAAVLVGKIVGVDFRCDAERRRTATRSEPACRWRKSVSSRSLSPARA